jgi:hypothetical protein
LAQAAKTCAPLDQKQSPWSCNLADHRGGRKCEVSSGGRDDNRVDVIDSKTGHIESARLAAQLTMSDISFHLQRRNMKERSMPDRERIHSSICVDCGFKFAVRHDPFGEK